MGLMNVEIGVGLTISDMGGMGSIEGDAPAVKFDDDANTSKEK